MADGASGTVPNATGSVGDQRGNGWRDDIGRKAPLRVLSSLAWDRLGLCGRPVAAGADQAGLPHGVCGCVLAIRTTGAYRSCLRFSSVAPPLGPSVLRSVARCFRHASRCPKIDGRFGAPSGGARRPARAPGARGRATAHGCRGSKRTPRPIDVLRSVATIWDATGRNPWESSSGPCQQ